MTLKFVDEMGPACGAGGSIKPGVERERNPRWDEQPTVAREGGRQTERFQVMGILIHHMGDYNAAAVTRFRGLGKFSRLVPGADAPGFMLIACSAGYELFQRT